MAKSVKQPVETPPYLKQVRIRDYAPLRDAKADFKPGLNIIIGSNGAGKTRFLSLVSQAAAPYQNHQEGEGCELVFGYDQDIKITFQQASGQSPDDTSWMSERGMLEVAVTYCCYAVSRTRPFTSPPSPLSGGEGGLALVIKLVGY